MKKYILSLMVSLAAVFVPAINASIPHCTPVHVVCDVTIEHAQKLIQQCEENGYDSVNPCLEYIENMKTKGYLNSYTVKKNELKKLDNSSLHYTFDAVVHVNPSSCKEAKFLLETFIKNKSNHRMMYKAVQQEFDNAGRNRSLEIRAWMKTIQFALYRGGFSADSAKIDLNNPVFSSLMTGTKIGACMHDQFGCTVKINEFKCELVK